LCRGKRRKRGELMEEILLVEEEHRCLGSKKQLYFEQYP
jgi:hypothetical protein